MLGWIRGKRQQSRGTSPKRNESRLIPTKPPSRRDSKLPKTQPAPTAHTHSEPEEVKQLQAIEDLEIQQAIDSLTYLPKESEKLNPPQPKQQPSGVVEQQAKKNGSSIWCTIKYVLVKTCIFTVILTLLLIVFGLKPWEFQLIMGTTILSALATFGTLVIKKFGPKSDNTHSTSSSDTTVVDKRNAPDDESWDQSTHFLWEEGKDWFLKNRFIRALVIIAVIALSSVSLTYAIYIGTQFRTAKDAAKEQNQTEEPSDGEETSIPESPEQNTPAKSDASAEAENPAAFLQEPERHYTLSDEEAIKLFFLDEPYILAVGNSASDIARKIKPFIEELLAVQRENIFDRDAPENIKGEIANASRLEERMTNSDELDQVIATRMDVWPDYPKYRIAKLLANNMQTYAKEYTKINGNYETIKYYHAQSIFWTWKSLTFASVTSYTLKNDLNYIRMRYHDIADKAAFGSEDQLRASTLSEAFMILENMEFSFEDEAFPETPVEDRDISDSDMILENGEAFEYE